MDGRTNCRQVADLTTPEVRWDVANSRNALEDSRTAAAGLMRVAESGSGRTAAGRHIGSACGHEPDERGSYLALALALALDR